MSFVKCPHTCFHEKSKTDNGIFWTSGSSYRTHVASKPKHPRCNKKCPAFGKSRMQHDIVTREDWMASADDVFLRFNKRSSKNVNALSAIPIHLLSKGKEGNQQLHPLYEAFKAGTLREPRLYSAADLEISECLVLFLLNLNQYSSHQSQRMNPIPHQNLVAQLGRGKEKRKPPHRPSPLLAHSQPQK